MPADEGAEGGGFASGSRSKRRKSSVVDSNIVIALRAREALLKTGIFCPSTVDKMCNSFGFCSESGKRVLRAGELLLEAGDACDTVWFIGEGKCRVVEKDGDNETTQQPGSTMKPSSIIKPLTVLGYRNCVLGWPAWKRGIAGASEQTTTVYPLFSRDYFDSFLEVDINTQNYVSLYMKLDPDFKGLNINQFGTYLEGTKLGRPSEDVLKSMFAAMDAKNNGLVELDEVLAVLQLKTGDEQVEEEESVLFAETMVRCSLVSHFECLDHCPDLEQRYRAWFGHKNAKKCSEGLLILTGMTIFSFVVKAAFHPFPFIHPGNNRSGLVLGLGLVPLTLAMLITTHATHSGRALVEQNYDVVSGVVCLVGACLLLLTEDIHNYEKLASYVGIYKVVVYIFGFSKLRLLTAVQHVLITTAGYQVYLIFTGRLRPDGGLYYVFGFIDCGPPTSAMTPVLLFCVVMFCMLSNAQQAEKLARRGFLVAMDLINEDKKTHRLATASTASMLLMAKAPSKTGRTVVGEQMKSGGASIHDEDDANVNALSDSLDEFADANINFYTGTFTDSRKEMLFVEGRFEKSRPLFFKKCVCIGCAGCGSFLNFKYLSPNEAEDPASQLFAFTIPFVFICVVLKSKLSTLWKRRLTVLSIAWVLFCCCEIQLYHFSTKIFGSVVLSAGCLPKTVLLSVLSSALITNSVLFLTFVQKLSLMLFLMANFFVGVSYFKYEAFYSPTNNTCIECNTKWSQHSPDRGLGMTVEATWLACAFTMVGGLINSWRGEFHQRQAFAGVLQREAETQLAKVKARKLSKVATKHGTGMRAESDVDLLTAAGRK